MKGDVVIIELIFAMLVITIIGVTYFFDILPSQVIVNEVKQSSWVFINSIINNSNASLIMANTSLMLFHNSMLNVLINKDCDRTALNISDYAGRSVLIHLDNCTIKEVLVR